MGGANRRLFLSGMGSILLRRAVPAFGGGMLASVSTPANAWVLQALGIVSSITGMLGGRSDGGVGAMLQANHDQLKLALSSLADLHRELGDVLKAVENLSGDIDRRLTNAKIRDFYRDIRAVEDGYESTLNRKDAALTFEQWRLLPTTQSDVSNYYYRIKNARELIQAERLSDPATALVASSSCYVEIGLRALMGASSSDLQGITDDYVKWFKVILDPAVEGSAAHYAVSARDRLADLEKAAAESEFGKAYGIDPGQKFFVCTGVNDYKKEVNYRMRLPGCKEFLQGPSQETRKFAARGDFFDSYRDSAEASTSDGPAAARLDYGVGHELSATPASAATGAGWSEAQYGPCEHHVYDAGRNGPHERLASDVVLREVEFAWKGQPTGLLQLQVDLQADRFGIAGQEGLPADANCSVDTIDMAAQDARRRHMSTMAKRRTAEEALARFRLIVADMNQERARAMFGVQAMLAAEKARQKLAELRRQYP